MRIALLGKSDGNGGGAGRVAEQLAHGLRVREHTVTQYFARSDEGFDAQHRPLYGPPAARALVRRGQRIARALGFPNYVPFELPALLGARIASHFDIVHVHDPPSAISPWTIRYLAAHIPTFWTFHDCSGFTGGCLYPMDCDRYHGRCGERGGCPQLGRWPLETRFDRTGVLQAARIAVHRDAGVHVLAPSQWMADTAFASGKLRVRPFVLSNGIDTAIFAPPLDRAALRAQLDIPAGRPVVVLSADTLEDERKGVAAAIAALQAVSDLRPFVVLVGNANDAIRAALHGIDHRFAGFIRDERVLAQWYGVADVFLFCSLADNQPLSILETLSCGVSMVGYATGGIPEIIDETCGVLVPAHAASALRDALRSALDPGVAARRGTAARARALERYDVRTMVARHIDAYERETAPRSTGAPSLL